MYTTLISEYVLFEEYDNPDWIIFDTRYDLMEKNAGKVAYLQGHVPGAIYVDLHDDLSKPPSTNKGRHPLPTVATINALFSELGIHSNMQVVVYDDNGGAFAARLWWMLRYMQHKNVAVLDGGWKSWLTAKRPVNQAVVQRMRNEFKNSALIASVVDIEEVDNFERIIDSREPARYRGEVEPVDNAAGHIPGAINRFWKDNLAEDGIFKTKQKLKQEFEEIFGNTKPEDAVFYCGSGVTACHNLLAAAHAGLKLPKLYAGSWSEWSSTPGKPVVTEI
ncbi:MAG: sulfurtransferase [marine bacterium B5-7]|nr:MAG: sulfurtransferase [marine bacterium B5-7]